MIKIFSQYFLCAILLLSLACRETPTEKDNLAPQNTNPYVLENELIRFQVAPDTGGRIASFKYKGEEILSQIRDKENFLWGSTIWPAPQSAWGWPPPAAMDQGQYTLVSNRKNQLIIDSPKDAYQGIQLRKKFTLSSPNTIDIEYTFTNHSDSIVNTGIWEISRIPFSGKITWKSGSIREHNYIGLTQIDSLSSFLLGKQKEPGKLFIDSDGGWINYLSKGFRFSKYFDIVSAEAVAPEQAPIEVYFDPPRGFAEIEQHAAYLSLAPGAQSKFKVKWRVEDLK